ncbi:MAG TPA: DUF3592 domain-containing protein, partial [Actinoplanes sp.]|nr:DUF3592 domain-containing protein [Actinoplanes sp.]
MSPEPVDVASVGARRWGRAGRVAGWAAFVLTPWLSLGFGTPFAYALVAALFSRYGRARAVVLWLSVAGYAAALMLELAVVDAAPGTTGEDVFIACLVVTVVGGGLQALVLTIWAVRRYGLTGRPAVSKAVVARQQRRRIDEFRWSAGPAAQLPSTPSEPTHFGVLFALAALLAAGGVFACVEGVSARYVAADLQRRGVPTTAVVVAAQRTYMNGTSAGSDITVTFVDAAGVPRRATHRGRDEIRVGDRLHIVYDPLAPTHVSWDTAIDYGPLNLGVGVTFLAGAVITTWKGITARR